MGKKERGRNKNRQGGWSRRKDGRLDVYVTVDTPHGTRLARTTKKTEDEADEWITTTKYEARRGAFLSFDASTLTTGQFVDRWLEDSVRDSVRKITYATYRQDFERHIEPTLGRVKLSRLTPAHVQAWQRRLIDEGVGAGTVSKALRLLKRALRQAAAWEMIPRNPAEYVKGPRYRPKETAYVRYEDVWRYLEAVKGDPFEALFVVAATGGPRPAELLALRWEDWDEAAPSIMIDESASTLGGGEFEYNSPKTDMGRRRIPLTGVAGLAMREHHRRFLEMRLRSGERGDYGKHLVFSALGDPSRPYSRFALYSRWRRHLQQAGLPHVSIYALRHTATMLLARAKTDPKTAQGILGHADVVTTLRIYTHFVQENAVEAVRNLDKMLGNSPE